MTDLQRLRQIIVKYKHGTASRTPSDERDVYTIQQTLNVVLAQIDQLVAAQASAAVSWDRVLTAAYNHIAPGQREAFLLEVTGGETEVASTPTPDAETQP